METPEVQELIARRNQLMMIAPRTGQNNKGGRFLPNTPELKEIREVTEYIQILDIQAWGELEEL